ncbi:MAG: LysR family transcriptional regulator [Herbaspirillum sp.]
MANLDCIDRQIRYFLKIAECSSLSRASEELDVTQSGLSRQLATLEASIGKPLFVRTGRGVRLTDAGEKLQKETYDAYAQIDAAIDSIKEKESLTEGNLRIAVIHTLSYYFVPNLLAKFIGQRGHINLSLMARSSPGVVDLIERGKADVGFVYDSAVASDALESKTLFADEMCLIVRQDDFNNATSLDITSEKVPLVGFPEEYALRKMLKSSGLDTYVVAEANTVEAMLRLVSAGIGSCILPRRIPDQSLAEYRLRKIELIAPVLMRRIVAIVRTNTTTPSMARQLLEMAAATAC